MADTERSSKRLLSLYDMQALLGKLAMEAERLRLENDDLRAALAQVEKERVA